MVALGRGEKKKKEVTWAVGSWLNSVQQTGIKHLHLEWRRPGELTGSQGAVGWTRTGLGHNKQG